MGTSYVNVACACGRATADNYGYELKQERNALIKINISLRQKLEKVKERGKESEIR